jgi:hypothetical protein
MRQQTLAEAYLLQKTKLTVGSLSQTVLDFPSFSTVGHISPVFIGPHQLHVVFVWRTASFLGAGEHRGFRRWGKAHAYCKIRV